MTPQTDKSAVPEHIVDIPVEEEMQSAFLEYAYSVIYARALPDARDGLKPVQRRILYSMREMGLNPAKPFVKSSRIVGEVMGKYHPHGDSAIYDTLVRLAQDFTMRLPVVTGHGNFGSLDQGPAASRYTEARPAPAAELLTNHLLENTVDFVPNYDESLTQPEVLPAAFPNLLVNGATGIAVGMATNMPPHNLGEVISAARHLLKYPQSSLEDLMSIVPGPDLPCGGRITGLDGIRQAYATGRGTFRTRATIAIEPVTARRKGIIVTELPYMVGPEKVIERIKVMVRNKKLLGIADVNDLSDRHHGLRLVIEVKSGFNPEAVLADLYRLTPMEESFGINNVTLVDGQPQTLGLKELLEVYLAFRIEVVRRRSQHRLDKHLERLHLVEGLLIAILDIDEVIQLIRSSDDTDTARKRLQQVFDLSEQQADYILELQLRRLTKFSLIELQAEQDSLREAIAELRNILDNSTVLRDLVSDELAQVSQQHATARRTVLLEQNTEVAANTPLKVADDPCWVLLSSTGKIARTVDNTPVSVTGRRDHHDAVVAWSATTARNDIGVITSKGRLIRTSVMDMPVLVTTANAPSLTGGVDIGDLLHLPSGETAVGLWNVSDNAPGLVLGTKDGVVKRVNPEFPQREEFEVITLKKGDRVLGAYELDASRAAECDLVFLTTDAKLLRFAAATVRPQGRAGQGIVGVKLSAGERALFFGPVPNSEEAIVVTVAGDSGALPGTDKGAVKASLLADFPPKGRATMGVRAHRFLRGQNTLLFAWAGASTARAANTAGEPVPLPPATAKRDGSGEPAKDLIAAIGALPAPPQT